MNNLDVNHKLSHSSLSPENISRPFIRKILLVVYLKILKYLGVTWIQTRFGYCLICYINSVWHLSISYNWPYHTSVCPSFSYSSNIRRLMRKPKAGRLDFSVFRMILNWFITWMWPKCSQIVSTKRAMKPARPGITHPWTCSAWQPPRNLRRSLPTPTTNSPSTATLFCLMPWMWSIPGMQCRSKAMYVIANTSLA